MIKSAEHLKKIPLFQSLKEDDLQRLNGSLKPLEAAKGSIIISEGEVGDCLYIISSGKVKVLAELGEHKEEIILSYLGTGDYFGEMSLITGDPRSATVQAEEDASLWQLDKKDFDALLIDNPSISLSLTHMLSQRLNLANRARESSERYYKHRITPRGSLNEVDLVKLLKYAEENSLSGKIRLLHAAQEAIFVYDKGRLEHLDFEDKDEDAAMDEILDWPDGEFIIEPSVFKISQDLSEKQPAEKLLEDNMLVGQFERYLKEKFESLIKFAGTHAIQSALNKSYYKFDKYFEVVSEIKITTEPVLKINLHQVERWTEKHTLFLAVLMRDVSATLSRDLLGMDFWNYRAKDEELNKILESSQFYTFYEQAVDFIGE